MSVVDTFDDPNDQPYILNELTLSCINQHAPLRRVKRTRPPAPWMTDLNIQALQHKKDNQRLILKHSNKESDKKLYKDTKKQLKAEIKRTKKTFYQKALLSKNSKEVWSTIHRILKPKPKRIKVDPKVLNEYYSTLATKLTSNTNNNRDNLKSFINELPAHNVLDSFTIQPTTHNEFSKILQNMRSDSSTDHDCIPIKILKFVADDISLPLTNIINNSIQINVFPAQWKIRRICPIPKVRNPVQMKDYLPVSILPAMSKVYEKVLLKQLSAFIKQMMLYKNTQSGYRKSHSSITLLLKLQDDIQKAMNRNEVTLSLFADYSKAFDTVDHKTLLHKLHSLQFSHSSLHLMNSCLTERKQHVQIDDKRSPLARAYYGVPQDSILGPILLNLYVHDLSESSTGECLQLADEPTLYRHCKPKDITVNAKILEANINSLELWSKKSTLVFNTDKTKTILFQLDRSQKHHLDNPELYTVKSKDTIIKREVAWKVLGITFHQNSSWKDQITTLITARYSTLRTLKKVKRQTQFHVRKMLAESLILSRINYGIVLYKNAPAYLIKRIQRLQNAVAGYVLTRYFNEKYVISLNWLPIIELIDFEISKLAQKALHDESWIERSKENQTFHENAEKVFNKLPLSVREKSNYKIFCNMTIKFFHDKGLTRIMYL